MSALENALARLEFLRSVDRCGKAYSDNRGGVAFPVDIWVDRVLIFLRYSLMPVPRPWLFRWALYLQSYTSVMLTHMLELPRLLDYVFT